MEEFLMLYIILALCSSLSLIGGLFIITAYIKLKKIRCFAFRIVLYLSIFHSCENLSNLIPSHLLSPSACLAQGIVNQFFGLCHILWTGFICIIVYYQAIKNKPNTEYYEKLFLVITLSTSSVCALITLFTKHYGYVGGDCWIQEDREGFVFRFAFFYTPAWFIVILISVFYFKLIRFINSQPIFAELDYSRRLIIRKLKVYPLIMICGFLPLSVYRIWQLYNGPSWFYAVGLAFYGSVGLANAIVYGLNESVKAELLKKNEYESSSLSMDKSLKF